MNNPWLVVAGLGALLLMNLPALWSWLKARLPQSAGVEGDAGPSSNFAPASPPPQGCAEYVQAMQNQLVNESADVILLYLSEGLTLHQALQASYMGGPDAVKMPSEES